MRTADLIFEAGDPIAISLNGSPEWFGEIAFTSNLHNTVFIQFNGDSHMNWKAFRTDVWDIRHVTETP